MVALLLTEGNASVNACDNEKRTPLHSAAWQGHAAIVRLLLEHGATPDHTCNQGATALGMKSFKDSLHFDSIRISVLRDITKIKKKSSMLKMSKTFILHNNNAGKLLINRLEKNPLNNQNLSFFYYK